MHRPDVLSTQDGRHASGSDKVPPGVERSLIKADGHDVRPALITISWSVDTPFPGAPVALPGKTRRLQGRLDFGNLASQHSVEFDLGRGGQITVTATAFHFKVRNSNAAGIDFFVRAAASYETRVGNDAARVTLTNKFQVDMATQVTLVAPSFAQLVTLFLNDWGAIGRGDIVLEFLGLDGAVEYAHNPTNCTVRDAVALPNDVAFIRVSKTAPGLVRGALLYHLGL